MSNDRLFFDTYVLDAIRLASWDKFDRLWDKCGTAPISMPDTPPKLPYVFGIRAANPLHSEGLAMKKPAERTKGIRIGIRISLQDHLEIQRLAKTREFSSSSALVRAAIRNEIHSREGLTGMEERISSSFERLSHENLRLSRALQALFALVDALTKTFLTCIPEPTAEVKAQAVAIARERYHKLIKSAGSGMSGDTHATMDGILSNDSKR